MAFAGLDPPLIFSFLVTEEAAEREHAAARRLAEHATPIVRAARRASG